MPHSPADASYIDSQHNYKAVRETIDRWMPVLKVGGILAGHDFCRSNSLARGDEEGPETWPTSELARELEGVPRCGNYGCNRGAPPSPPDCNHGCLSRGSECKPKGWEGKPRRGFAGVAAAAQHAAAAAGARITFTLEGREGSHQETTDSLAGCANPSWWMIKRG